MKVSKVTAEQVKGLQNTKNKERARVELLNIISRRFRKEAPLVAHTLCGDEPIFEQKLLEQHKNTTIKCFENSRSVYTLAAAKLPRKATIAFGDWMQHLADGIPDVAWADYCSSPCDDRVLLTQFELSRHLAANKAFVYAVTFSSPRKKGGREGLKQNLQSLSKDSGCKIRSSSTFASSLARYYYRKTGHCPAAAIYYAGGKEKKSRMVTLVWTDDKTFAPAKWQNSSPLGCRKSQLVDVYKEQSELAALTPGQKAWATRFKRELQAMSPQKRAWITRRRNERIKRSAKAMTATKPVLSPQKRAWITRRKRMLAA